MGWTASTLSDVVEKARQAFRAFLPGADAWLWPNNIYVAAKVKGALTKLGLDYADYIARQAFVHLADEPGIEAHAAEWGIPRIAAMPAQGTVLAAGGVGGMMVSDGAVLRRGDGQIFNVITGASVPESTTTALRVVAGAAGASGQTDAGAALSAFSGVLGLGTFAVDAAGLDGGRDMEDYDSWRQRIWWRKKYTPAGGAPADWVAWAREVPGVTRVYVERRWLGAGTIRIIPYFDASRVNGIPTAADVANVRQHLDGKFSCGTVVVAAPSTLAVNITISGLQPATADVQAEIRAEIASLFRRRARPAGNDTGHPDFDFLMVPTSFSLSWIDEAISNAAGEQRHILSAPAADIVLSSGQAPVPGVISFV